ncbi:MAG TPA: OB-fold nucleic acid binding domain-containing protein, partial [Bacteroidales bacterium]|nr:OB-fold nucleic acid binding domain-containing protein [Bacteroidales bacterium]
MERKKIKELLSSHKTGKEVLVKGWVRTKRGSKSIVFIALNDGSTINNIQIVADTSLFKEDLLKEVTTGACLAVTGTLVESMGQGQNVEIKANSIELYGKCDAET